MRHVRQHDGVQLSNLLRLAIVASCAWCPGASAATIVPTEANVGTLQLGQRILVDDGSCPPGQIKEISVTSNPQAKSGQRTAAGAVRIKRCIKR
jgi:hypothetical protein